MQFEGIRTVLHDRDQYVWKSSKGIDQPSMLRSGWYSCIGRDSSKQIFFWLMMIPNISDWLKSKQYVGLAKKCLQTSEHWSNLC